MKKRDACVQFGEFVALIKQKKKLVLAQSCDKVHMEKDVKKRINRMTKI